jgi:DSF synthase
MSNLNDAAGLRVPYGRTQSQFQTEYEPATATAWGYFNPRGNACFSLGLLKDIREHDRLLAERGGRVEVEGELRPVHFYVCASRVPRIFNLGGDLALFVLLIKSRDREALQHYARLCIDNMHARIGNYGAPGMITISLVQGDALGGGLECALSSDVLVAEEGAQMGLPEILFNLFPGMGAYSLLARRGGPRLAERLMLSGRVYSAAELHELGVVDALAPPGGGETAVQEWIARHARRRNGHAAVMRVRQQVFPVTRAELDAIAETWVDCALRLEDRDLRMMGRVVRAQMERMERGTVVDVGAAAAAAEAAAVAV